MRILSGIQPTSKVHLGNYIGAISLWEEELKKHENATGIFFIADYHAITVPHDPKQLKEAIYFILATYLAAGFNPKKHIIFVQSHNPDHTEAAWIIQTQTPIGWLERMTQYKDKRKKLKNEGKSIPTGLLTYPALMAADILLYDTDIVPVGEDQRQHLEYTREIAQRINNTYGNVFKLPTAQIRKFGAKIMDLSNPTKKMSKSASSYKGVIFVTDSNDKIYQKFKRAVTDNINKVQYNPQEQPGISNLIVILSLVTNKPIENIVDEYSHYNYAKFKEIVAQAVISYIEPLRAKIQEYLAHKDMLETSMKEGVTKAREISTPKLTILKRKLGYMTI